MFLFEVHERVRPGFKLVLRNGDAAVPMGHDDASKGAVWLPLGNSIERELQHPDDQNEIFVLMHAKLDEHSGLKLIAQYRDEAQKDDDALVLVDGCADPELGTTNIAEAYGRAHPELITYTSGGGMTRRLYHFKKGDALFISWSARSLDQARPKRFIIAWDGVELTESPVSRPRRRMLRQQKVKERQEHLARAELRP